MPSLSASEVSSSDSTKKQLKAFEVAMFRCREDMKNEKNLASADKIVQILNKSSDYKSMSDNSSFLTHIQWILSNTTSSSSLTWNCISLLTKLCVHVPKTAGFLASTLKMVDTCTNLLSVHSSSKCVKILDLLRHLVYGIRIQRQESYLENLLLMLIKFLNQEEEEAMISSSLAILACLTQHNYLVAKLFMTLTTDEERRHLFARTMQDSRHQILLAHLHFCLSRSNLSSTLMLRSKTCEGYLINLSNAFLASYGEDDTLSLKIFNDFLNQLNNTEEDGKSEQEKSTALQVAKELLLAADYAENEDTNELLFEFVRSLARHFYSDNLSYVDISTKALLLRLDDGSSCVQKCSKAVALVNDVLEQAVTVDTLVDIDDTTMQSLRLQMDQVVNLLTKVLVNNRHLECVENVLKTCCTVAQISDWADLVAAHLNAKEVLQKIKSLNDTAAECQAGVVTLSLKLAKRLAHKNNQWKNLGEEMLHDPKVIGCLAFCVQKMCHAQDMLPDILAIVHGDQGSAGLFAKALTNDDLDKEMRVDVEQMENGTTVACFKDAKEIEQVLETVRQSVDKQDVDGMLYEILELNDFRLSSQQLKMEALTSSLRAAEMQISQQNILKVQQEAEISKLNHLTKHLLKSIRVAEMELADVRMQYSKFHKEATEQRVGNTQELGALKEELAAREEQKTKLINKLAKYKEHMEALQNAIKDHQQVQEELQEKFNAVTKTNSETSMALAKTEEKLKKKERQREEERQARESLEKEMEALKKEISSLQTLNKRQEQALAKKDKQLSDQTTEIENLENLHAQIFNLSKIRGGAAK